jgi:hypothetical protein
VADSIAKSFGGYMKPEISATPKEESAFRLLNLEGDRVMDLAQLISQKMEYFDMLVGSV